jgi:glucose-1-phosphate cytidylyltransferase
MRVVLFCGGLGMRMRALGGDNVHVLRRAADLPKPMIEVGERPLLWHLMKWYAHFGHTEFVLCLGHRGDVIRSWFLSLEHEGVESLDSSMPAVRVRLSEPGMEGWLVTLVETGPDAVVGQRLLSVQEFVADQDVFLANYSDGLSDVPLPDLVELNARSGAVATFMSVPIASTLHTVSFSHGGRVDSVGPLEEEQLWINGGFFVLRKEIFSYMRPGDELVMDPFARLIGEDRLTTLPYGGFWVALDTEKDRRRAEELWASTRPWAVWEQDETQERALQPVARAS